MGLSVDIEKKLGSFLLKISFEANEGTLGLLGASGCGKSMTLKCIAGIENPDRGRIVLDDVVLFDSAAKINLPPQKRNVGYLFQQYALFPNMTVEKNIFCGFKGNPSCKRLSKSALKEKAGELVAMMGLDGLEKKYPSQLSGGQQQRVAIARMLASDPKLILLDEPFSALDSQLRFTLEAQLREVLKRRNQPVIFVSHNRDEVYRLSDTMAVIKDGTIETMGDKHEVFLSPQTVNGARMTGCKNISEFQVLSGNHVFAKQWNINICVDAKKEPLLETATHIGLRMHNIDFAEEGDCENVYECRVEEEIENPFSYTLMLRVIPNEQDETGELNQNCTSVCLGMELSKERWERHRASTIMVKLPKEAFLILKDD